MAENHSSEHLSEGEIQAILISTQKHITSIAHQLELLLDQADRLHDKLCDCATRLKVLMHFWMGGE